MPFQCVAHLDFKFEELAQQLSKLSVAPGYDDGSYGPVFVRLAWHASGTYDQGSKTGGSDGATMRFAPEATDDANAGLDIPRKVLEKAKPDWLSLADLWILASYVFIEESGGPAMRFEPGRTDFKDEQAAKKHIPPNGRLPDAGISYTDKQKVIGHIKDVFSKQMGFDDVETVALCAGGHAYGRCHKDRSGFNGPWQTRPTKFTNIYVKRLLKDKWAEVNSKGLVCPVSGKDGGKCPILPSANNGRQQY